MYSTAGNDRRFGATGPSTTGAQHADSGALGAGRHPIHIGSSVLAPSAFSLTSADPYADGSGDVPTTSVHSALGRRSE
jgi:hypothetical protein